MLLTKYFIIFFWKFIFVCFCLKNIFSNNKDIYSNDSSTNELPLCSIDFELNPLSPELYNFDEFTNQQHPLGFITTIATNERPLSYSLLSNLNSDKKSLKKKLNSSSAAPSTIYPYDDDNVFIINSEKKKIIKKKISLHNSIVEIPSITITTITAPLTTTTTTTNTTTNCAIINNTTIPHKKIVKIHNPELPNSSNSTVRRQRHSIAGQMNYFKFLGFGGFNKKINSSANSLFSTAVISGSSSAPNLRDIISNTITSPSG